jgi:hypothetical protein
MRRSVANLAFLLAFCAPLCAQDMKDALLAPLPIRDQFLLNNGFFFFEPEQARVLDENESAVTLNVSDSNTFAKSAWISMSLAGQNSRLPALDVLANSRFHLGGPLYLVDGETHRVELAMRRGFGHNLEMALTVPISTIGGGWSDSVIEAVHRAFSLGNANREALRRNSETVYLRTATAHYVRNRSVGYAIGDIALTGKYELQPFEDGAVSLSLCGAIKLPTGRAETLDGSGSADAGLQLLASRDFSLVRVHASLSVLRLGANRPLGTSAQVLISDTVAVSRLVTDRTSAAVELTISESPFKRIGIAEFNRRSYQISAGMQRQFGRSLVVYAALIENLLTYENSADAGVAWGMAKRF